MNSKGKGIVGGKLVRPAIPCSLFSACDSGKVANPWFETYSILTCAKHSLSMKQWFFSGRRLDRTYRLAEFTGF